MSDHTSKEEAAPAALPSVDDLPTVERGFDPDRVREAFDAFRRHAAQLQAQLRVLHAAQTAELEPTGHVVRMDALHLIRAAAEFADEIERDAQNASAAQLRRAHEEIRRQHDNIREREAAFDGFRAESERQRTDLLSAAAADALEMVANAKSEASRELRDAEAQATRLVENARQQAVELTNSARAEVERTLEWARAQTAAVVSRAQRGAEQLLASAGLGEEAAARVAEAIVREAEQTVGVPRPSVVAVPVTATSNGDDDADLHWRQPSALAWAEPKP
jgi:hypothetical protein